MQNNTNPLIVGGTGFVLAVAAVVGTLYIGDTMHAELAVAEILSGGIFGAAIWAFSKANGIYLAGAVLAMVTAALIIYVDGVGVVIGGTAVTAAWIVSLRLLIAFIVEATRKIPHG